MDTTSPPSINWQVKEYEPRGNNPDWIWGLGLLMVIGIILAIIFSNFLLGIIIALGGSSLIMYAKREPEMIEYEVNQDGIRAGKTFYPYKNLDSFWILDQQPAKKLLLESKRSFIPLIDLPLGEANPKALYAYLSNHLKVEKHEESIINLIADWLNI